MDKRIRLFEIVQQVDKIDLDLVFSWLDKIDCKYLCVLHDKDNDKNIHYHIMVNSANARSISDISKNCDVCPQYIERGKSNFNNMCAYAFHLTDNCEKDGKFIYDHTAVVKSRDIDIDKIFNDDIQIKYEKQHNDDIKNMLYAYGNLEKSRQDIIDSLSPIDFAKFNKLFKQMQEYRQLKIKDRNMQVIYITGLSETGKTTLAKFMARSKNYDMFISGSGKDILDGYDKQECIILDDLRDDIFKKAELFKLCDNNTNSSVKSRYNNKDISNCKLMIITSVKAPHRLYNWFENKDDEESFMQFARRLNYNYVLIKAGEIYTIQYDATTIHNLSYNNQDFLKDAKFNLQDIKMSLVFTAMGISEVVDKNAELKSLFDSCIDEINRQEKNKQISIDDLTKDN